jgi:hypothetical protein
LGGGRSQTVVDVPNAKQIVIASTCKLLSIRAPLEAAHLLPMAHIGAQITARTVNAHIVVNNLRV